MSVKYNDTVDFYINGIEPSSYNYVYSGWSTLSNTRNAQIGVLGTTSRLMNGTIDEVRIYNRALSAGEINLLFQKYRGKFGI